MKRRAASTASSTSTVGDREALLGAGGGEDLAARVDDLRAARRAASTPKVPAWFADTHTIWFSSARARSNRSKRRVQRSSASTGARLVRARRPRRHAHADPGAVHREGARRLGEGLVVADHHAQPADRGVEGGEAVAGGVGGVLVQRLVHLAVAPEHAVAGDGDGAVVGQAAALGVAALAVARGDDHVAGHRDEARDLGAVGLELRAARRSRIVVQRRAGSRPSAASGRASRSAPCARACSTGARRGRSPRRDRGRSRPRRRRTSWCSSVVPFSGSAGPASGRDRRDRTVDAHAGPSVTPAPTAVVTPRPASAARRRRRPRARRTPR